MFIQKFNGGNSIQTVRFLSQIGLKCNHTKMSLGDFLAADINPRFSGIASEHMSRLGREYLQVGQYTELIFPSYGVRFIAVNDGVDSLYESTNDFTPFRNLMNDNLA